MLIAALALAAFTPSSLAGFRPSLFLDCCAWNATHIVVVTEGEKIDGVVEVLESWKGDLKKSDTLKVPELAAFASEESRVVSKRHFAYVDEDRDRPAHVSGSRMVLFIIKEQATNKSNKPAKPTWKPANPVWNEMQVSVAWIERGKVYAFSQQVNPGPSELLYDGTTEDKMKTRVLKIVAMHDAVAKAVALKDSIKMGEAMNVVVAFDSHWSKKFAIAMLVAAGKPSVPVLRKLLKDDSLGEYHASVIKAMAKAGGAELGPELNRMLEQDVSFWKKTGPTLKKDWWNGAGLSWEDVEPLRRRYIEDLRLLEALGDIRFTGGRKTVIAFRDLWSSVQQLNEVGGWAEACDSTLDKLPKR